MTIIHVPLEALRYEPVVRSLCVRPYPLHPRGCPNFGKKEGCPPRAPRLPDHFDLSQSCYIIYNVFDFGAHVAKMRETHPEWSDRQLTCCLYWQAGARKKLQHAILSFHAAHPECVSTTCPEAMGLDVTATLAALGVDLEWPPKTRAIQVAFAGVPR